MCGALRSKRYCVLFDPSINTYINFGNDTTVNNMLDESLTLEGWFNAYTKETSGAILFWGKNYNIDHGWGTKYYQKTIPNDPNSHFLGAFNFQTKDSDRFGYYELNDHWHHIAVQYDVSTRNTTVYIDGMAHTSGTSNTGEGIAWDDSAVPGLIGAYTTDGGYNISGMGGWQRISNVVRYTSNFTPNSLFNPPASDANTIRLFKLDEGSGTTIIDYSSNALNATLANGFWAKVDSSGTYIETRTFTVSGTITEDSTSLSGVDVTMGATTVTTGADGKFSFSGLTQGTTGTITPVKATYIFDPVTISVSAVSADLPEQNFTAEVAPVWYLSGGIDASNCIGAYQAKGAADLAASYVNLANPGTYNLTAGGTTVWDTDTGWTFDTGANYLKTGITAAGDGTWTAIVRFTTTTVKNASYVFGSSNSAVTRVFSIMTTTANTSYYNTNSVSSGTARSGVLCITNGKAYVNGSDLGITLAEGSGTALPSDTYIGTLRYGTGTYGSFTGDIQAIAFYNTGLTTTQIGLLSTAMAAL